MDKGWCNADGMPGTKRRESLLAMVVEIVEVERLGRDHRDHNERKETQERRGGLAKMD